MSGFLAQGPGAEGQGARLPVFKAGAMTDGPEQTSFIHRQACDSMDQASGSPVLGPPFLWGDRRHAHEPGRQFPRAVCAENKCNGDGTRLTWSLLSQVDRGEVSTRQQDLHTLESCSQGPYHLRACALKSRTQT